MWATLLVLAICLSADPGRLCIVALLVSRPRPLAQLLAYWLGGMTYGVVGGLVALRLLGDVPTVVQNVRSIVASFTGGYVRIAVGVLVLLFAALFSTGFLTRRHAGVPMGDAAPPAVAQKAGTLGALARLSSRAQRVWEVGHPGVAFVVALGSAMPPAEYLVALVVIASSGAALSAQLGALVMFTVVVLALIEIPLVCYPATPTKTQAVLLHLQNWIRTYFRRFLAVIAAIGGVLLVTNGMASV
jgi:hypothetical protein